MLNPCARPESYDCCNSPVLDIDFDNSQMGERTTTCCPQDRIASDELAESPRFSQQNPSLDLGFYMQFNKMLIRDICSVSTL